MDDIRQRDLTGKRVQDMTAAERREMRRRLQEFVGQVHGVPAARPNGRQAGAAAKPQRWDPAAAGKAKPSRA